MELRFHLDPETHEPHIHQHGVAEDEVEAVLRRPGDDSPAVEARGSPSSIPTPAAI
jgi:hypothetical protein